MNDIKLQKSAKSSTKSQDKILYQIKRLGPQTAKSLAEQLGMTTMGARQHLSQLSDAGLVETAEATSLSRGRPVKPWKLTTAGHGRFPDAHAQVTSEIIASVRDLLGESALDQVIQDRAKQSLALYEAALADKASLEEKVECLAELRSQEGYMAEVATDGDTILLIENHCPICIAAQTCQGFCQSELESFQTLFGGHATVEREEYLLDGARRCSYRIKQK